MKKLKFLFFPTILALAFGLMLSCAKKDDSSSSETDTSSSSTVTVSGKVQKGPYVQGTEITVRELDSSMTPTGNTFTGTIDDNTGSFSIKGTLANKIAELAADGYYFNEVSGSLSTSKLALQAFSDLTDSSSVNVNLMTHLEKKRVEYLMDSSKMTFAAAKTQAQTEILKIFNIENVTLGNSETLDISKSGDGNAVLLAISAILQSDKTEAELTELLSTINTDIRTDGTLDSTNTKATLVTAVDYIKALRSTIRSNIESRYSNLGISATIPAFESYAFKLDTTAPTVSSTSPSNGATATISNFSATFSEVVDNSTLTTSTFTLTDNSSNSVSGTVSSSDNTTAKNTTVTFTPSDSFTGAYTATISNSVKDLNGNAMAQNYSWSFGNAGSWELVTSSANWGDRTGHVVLSFINKIWVLGGYTGDCYNFKNDIWSSADGVSWNQIKASASWIGRDGFAGVVFDDKMWVLGGHAPSNCTHNKGKDVWYSSDGENWTQATSNASFGCRSHHSAVVFDNKIYVIGGQTSNCQSGQGGSYNSDVYSSTDGINWTQVTSNAGLGNQSSPGLVVHNNKIWLFNGTSVYNTSDGSTWTTVNVDNSSGNSWSSSGLSAASLSNTLYIFGWSLTNPLFGSNDGINWTSFDYPSTTGIRASNNGVTMGSSLWMIGKQKVWKLK